MKRYVVALLAAALVVGIGPFVGLLTDFVKTSLEPRTFLILMAGAFAAPVGLFVVFALLHIRQHRLWRFAGLGLGLGLMALQLFVFNRDDEQVNAVERIHFLFYGVVAFFFYRAFLQGRDGVWTLVLTWLATAQVGILDEWLQWLVPVRTGEVMDVLLNVYAGSCGLLMSASLDPPGSWSWRLELATRRRLSLLLVSTVLLFGGFFHCAHLGYEIYDEEVGWFRSYASHEELLSLQEVRREQWRETPPTRPPLSKEDYYQTEAGWHTQHRNASFQRQDFATAWRENRLLEKYFEPFLDTERPAGRSFRLPPPQLKLLDEARPAAETAPSYYSPAHLGRIFIVPSKAQFWSLIAVAVGLCLVPALRRSQ